MSQKEILDTDIEEWLRHPVTKLFHKKLGSEIENLKDAMVKITSTKDLAQYFFNIQGQIYGLEAAMCIFE